MTAKKPPEQHKRGGRASLLTPEVQHRIVSYIRAGAWEYVAAGAAGVSYTTFNVWMTSQNPRYAEFQSAVREARLQARATAEIEVRRENPLAWLRQGPGRGRTPEEEGWTDETRKIDLRAELTGEIRTDHITDENARALLRMALAELGDDE